MLTEYATYRPSGEKTGQRSCEARIGNGPAEAGTATTSRTMRAPSFFTLRTVGRRSGRFVKVSWPACERRLRLHDVPGRQVLRPRPAGAGEHLPVFPAGGEDRRPRAERSRQVDGAPDHGREGGALVGRRRAR